MQPPNNHARFFPGPFSETAASTLLRLSALGYPSCCPRVGTTPHLLSKHLLEDFPGLVPSFFFYRLFTTMMPSVTS